MGTGAESRPSELWQVFGSLSTEDGSMRVGLSIARCIVDLHRAHICAENARRTIAIFRVTLRAASETRRIPKQPLV